MDSFYIPPGTVAEPTTPRSEAAPPPLPDPDRPVWSSGAESRAPLLNLLAGHDLGVTPAAAPAPADPAPAAPAVVAAPAPVTAPPKRRRWPLVVGVIAVVLLVSGVGAAWWLMKRPAPASQVAVSPSPSPTSSTSPSPSPTPSATPSPAPSAPPPPETVTAPAAAPTAEHPQAVKITSPSGLWLRSSATSANRSNIIGWMPNGATISVDQVGDFWWHGTYKGQAGYFAVKYTQ